MMRRLLAILSISAAPFSCAFAQVPGVTPNSILVGQSAAFSGPAAQLGIQMNIGAKFAGVGVKNIAVFYQNDAYGQAGLKGVELAMGRRNMKISALGTVERNTVKVEDAVKKISAVSPDAVVMISAYTSIAEFVRQMKRAGSAAQFYNVSFVGSKALADALQADGYALVISQVVPFPWSAKIPLVREYQLVLAERGIKDWIFSSLEGFIAA